MIKTDVRKYIAKNFMSHAPEATVEDTMPLISSGMIDSLGMIGLVDFLESHFEIEFMPREIDVDSLDTVERIETVVRRKLAGREAGRGTSCGQ